MIVLNRGEADVAAGIAQCPLMTKTDVGGLIT
jgi:hypothetical protein